MDLIWCYAWAPRSLAQKMKIVKIRADWPLHLNSFLRPQLTLKLWLLDCLQRTWSGWRVLSIDALPLATLLPTSMGSWKMRVLTTTWRSWGSLSIPNAGQRQLWRLGRWTAMTMKKICRLTSFNHCVSRFGPRCLTTPASKFEPIPGKKYTAVVFTRYLP